MKKSVLVGLCAVMVAIAGCEDAVSGDPGTNESGSGVVAVTGVSLGTASLHTDGDDFWIKDGERGLDRCGGTRWRDK